MQRGWDDHPTLFFLAMFSTFISEFVEALRILWLNGLMLGAEIVSVLCSLLHFHGQKTSTMHADCKESSSGIISHKEGGSGMIINCHPALQQETHSDRVFRKAALDQMASPANNI